VINGKIKIGLSKQEIEEIGSNNFSMLKLSRRDLPYAVACQKSGSTTVAATMICAQLAGIKVFATGGIGGVHREGEITMDVSADLYELAQTDVAVVCAGAKAILDIGRTLEVLETLGVPVVGYQTRQFPAFYYADSGYGVDCVLENPQEVANLLKTKRKLGLKGGILVTQPPPEETALSKNEIEAAIEKALQEAKALGVRGKNITPFLLTKTGEHTVGSSLKCNVSLIKKNAQTAAKLACALVDT